ncbi:prepilin-type N-terminal cleavage/methylation domain-containing protein [Candidatus Parcubacteria bacterium]|nr:MAG: prepilin-type N-terminal cleavage/methylation domain-containing protein [Candidatus Parcubacteria bacterium]
MEFFKKIKFKRKSLVADRRGFSLIELLVTVGILTMVNVMIFASYPEFSKKMSLRKTGNEVALIVRQAQAYALGIKRTEKNLGGEEFPGYGVHFNSSQSNNNKIVLFADINADGKLNDPDSACDSNDECVNEYEISTGDYVSKVMLCGANENCFSADGAALDVSFPRAVSMVNMSSSIYCPGDCSSAKIVLKSPRGKEDNTKNITIWRSGQITVE